MIETGGKPVDLVSKLSKDGFTMSVFALFDVLLIALLFSFLSSKFVLAPGFSIDLSSAPVLPSAHGAGLAGDLVSGEVSVLNVRGRGMIFFDGRIYNEDAFARTMQSYKPRGETLLLKTDAGVSTQTVLNIAAMARAAGFKRVQLAAVSDGGR